jgi:hypothetical protein
MTTRIDIRLDQEKALQGLEHLPGAVAAEVDAELGALAEQGAVMMKQRLAANGSMARTTLVTSIRAKREALMHWRVAPGVNYARAVEEGTGPAVGRPNYMPNPEHLEDYIRQRGGIKMAGKPGSSRRQRVINEIRDRAWGLAVHIWWHGTKPRPYVKPTAEQLRAIAPARVSAAVQRGLQKAFPA